MGYLVIDPRQYPGEPWLGRLMQELMRRAGADRLDHMCGRDAEGRWHSEYRMYAESMADEELSRLWAEVRTEHWRSVRWGAGERKKRRR